MSQPQHDRRMDYIEFPATDIPATKRFYGDVLGWEFEDYGPGYTSFTDGRIAGGFSAEGKVARGGGVLVVIYAIDFEAVEQSIIAAGGRIIRATFDFPGGRRFHFTDPSGNELAVWSDRPPRR